MPKRTTDESIRIPVSIAVEAAGDAEHLFLFTQNVSMTGMLLETEKLLSEDHLNTGDKINVLFYLPSGDGATIAAKAKVVRKEEVPNYTGSPSNTVAVEFVDMDTADRQNLRLFISDYETGLEQMLETDRPERDEEEVTDPETVLEALTGKLLIEPLLVDDYKFFYDRIKDLEARLAEKEEVNMSPMQLLLFEVLEQFSPVERRQLDELVPIDEPDFRQKIFLNLLLFRLKLLTEKHLLVSALEKEEQAEKDTLEYLRNYYTSTCFEVQQSNEAANLVGQKLVSDEKWLDFKSLNSLRNKLDQALLELTELLAPYGITGREAGKNEQAESPIAIYTIKEAESDIDSIIPDPEEEADQFPNGATGDEIRQLWEVASQGGDDDFSKLMRRALVVRRKVRIDYHKSEELEEEIIHYRVEVTNLYREDAKLIREVVTALSELREKHKNQSDTISVMIRILEALSYQFGQLIKMIPKRLLTTEEVETVRYRRTAFRRRSRSPIATITRFTRRHAAEIAIVFFLVVTGIFHLVFSIKSSSQPISIGLVKSLPVAEASKINGKMLVLTVERNNWERLNFSQQVEYLDEFEKVAVQEGTPQFKVLDKKGAVIAISFVTDTKSHFQTGFYSPSEE